MTRYLPSRNYLYLGLIALALAGLCVWMAFRWPVAAVPVGLFVATAALNFFLYRRPTIEITPITITIGDCEYLWSEISRIERTGWISPLVVWLIFKDGNKLLVIYPGAMLGARKLSEEMMRRLTRSRENAVEPVPVSAGNTVIKGPLLNADDEAEVERLFRRLKTVGHLESGSDEK